eukprot:TRINITY_DN1750_c0_g1_i4.p1 TRINITY_DN1750_c0_g1~~TRINITY_DN1750_c0_g1_i4.p1  ORF type:complete len:561 (+),score=87.33 TRINITY_DN1750_c0_g1_i4:237-1919(+)
MFVDCHHVSQKPQDCVKEMTSRFDESTSDEESIEEIVRPCLIVEMGKELEELTWSYTLEYVYQAGMGKMKKTKIRSIYWKIFLGEVTPPPSSKDKKISEEEILDQWEVDMLKNRKLYISHRDKHHVDPHEDVDDDEEALMIDNPLSDCKDSKWSIYFKQKQIQREIEKDLTRMSGEDILFEKPEIRALMLNILKTFALENPDTGYRQGMHDLVSSFVYFLWYDGHSLRSATPALKQELKPQTLDTLEAIIPVSTADIEADAYFMFDKLMNGANSNLKSWYKVIRNRSSTDEETPITRLCSRLQNTILPCYDAQLSKHLHHHGVEPTVYALRWFRVWFIREFDICGSAPLWDAVLTELLHHTVNETSIGSYSESGLTPLEMGLLPLIGAAMLSFVSQELRSKDYSGTLKRLMKYPPVEDVSVFVEKAVDWSGSPLKAFLPRKTAAPADDVVPLRRAPAPLVAPESSDKNRQPGSQPALSAAGSPKAQLDKILQSNNELSKRLQNILDQFQSTWFEHERSDLSAEDKVKQANSYLLAIAELKQIKDTLAGSIPPAPYIPSLS